MTVSYASIKARFSGDGVGVVTRAWERGLADVEIRCLYKYDRAAIRATRPVDAPPAPRSHSDASPPARRALQVAGSVRVPGDKSITHRALMLAAMARGRSHIGGALTSRDTRSTASA
ncbi:MAG: hypothetical protein H0U85_02505, partial [Gemmatimonadales bacterium]|nr:hypothetical protein [Gemmatimonadales bacterium]